MALYLLVRIDGERVALPADTIETVVELEAITPVPRVPPHVAGLAALRSRLVTVIDARVALGLSPAAWQAPVEAVIVPIDGHSYGLVVDAVEDVAEAGAPQPLQAPLGGRWAGAVDRLIEVEGALVMLIDPAALIAPRQAAAA